MFCALYRCRNIMRYAMFVCLHACLCMCAHSVPHDDVDVVVEGVVDVLGGKQVEEVAVMMVEVHS